MNLHLLADHRAHQSCQVSREKLLRQVKMAKAQKIQICRKPSIPLLMEPPINYKYKTSLESEIFSML